MKTELEERTKKFAVQVVKTVSTFPKTSEGQIIGRQLLKSGTSIGANYREANRAESKDDFVHKVGVAEKEAAETIYWLEICRECRLGIRETIEVVRATKNSIIVNKPSVIHLTSSASFALLKDFFILRVAKKFKVPVVMHWRFGRIPDLVIKKNWEWYLISLIICKSAYSIVIDNISYKALIASGFNNVANIANPVSEVLAKMAYERRKLGKRIVEESKLVFVGRVFVNKGIYELVKACVALPVVK